MTRYRFEGIYISNAPEGTPSLLAGVLREMFRDHVEPGSIKVERLPEEE